MQDAVLIGERIIGTGKKSLVGHSKSVDESTRHEISVDKENLVAHTEREVTLPYTSVEKEATGLLRTEEATGVLLSRDEDHEDEDFSETEEGEEEESYQESYEEESSAWTVWTTEESASSEDCKPCLGELHSLVEYHSRTDTLFEAMYGGDESAMLALLVMYLGVTEERIASNFWEDLREAFRCLGYTALAERRQGDRSLVEAVLEKAMTGDIRQENDLLVMLLEVEANRENDPLPFSSA